MKGLVIRRLAVKDFGVLRGHIDMGSIDPKLTLVTGANETGKSTLVEALRCALFERHKSRHAGIRALQPHNTRLAPEVWVTLAIDGAEVEVHKRFMEHPMVQVVADNGATVLTGDGAEDAIKAMVGARSPGKQGASRNDMGVWGLLWVTQDDAAFSDPGEKLDADARGSLHEAIGRHVAQVTGGKLGERLRQAVRETAARYFTDKTGQPTGELREAMTRLESARSRVAQIERRVAEVEEIAGKRDATDAQLEETQREQPGLARELEMARKAADDIDALRAEHRLYATALEAARERAERAEAESTARRALGDEVRELEALFGSRRDATEEMSGTLHVRREQSAGADEALSRLEAAFEAAKGADLKAQSALGAARRQAEAWEVRRVLTKVRELAVERATLAAGARDTLSDADYRAILEHDRRRRTLRDRLASAGTCLRVSDGDEERSWPVGHATTLDVPRLGKVTVRPARKGLAAAVARAGQTASALAERLSACGVESVQQAREARGARVESEVEHERLQELLASLAPSGVEALASDVSTDAERLVQLERLIEQTREIERLHREAREAQSRCTVDASSLEGLRRRVDAANLARAAYDAIGTSVEVLARGEIDFAIDDGDPQHLLLGERRELKLSRPTRLLLGDAEVRIAPGSEEIHKAAARLQSAEQALQRGLADAGVETWEQAQTEGQRWADLDARVRDARARLQQLAPSGVEALEEQRASSQARQQKAQSVLEEARGVLASLRRVEAVLAKAPVTQEALDRLAQIDDKLRTERAEVEARAARLLFETPEGPARTVVVESPWSEEVAPGVRCEVVPGEDGADLAAELDRVDRELESALHRAGVEGVEQAEERWRRGASAAQLLQELDRRLDDLAPEGVEALEARVADLPGVEEVSPERLGALETMRDARRRERDEAERARDVGRSGSERLRSEVMALAAELRKMEEQRDEAGDRLSVRRLRLESAQASVGDEELTRRAERRRAEADAALEKATHAARALEDAVPELIEGDQERARMAVEANARQTRDLREAIAGLDSVLARAAAEGRFEELADALAELREAEANLARVERDARAARLLTDTVERAYQEAQRAFVAPVVEVARPYLQALRPGTLMQLTSDLTLDKLVRAGAEEDFKQLSGGTREQVSVIVRLALARVLARDSRPLPLILDDTMGWTDDLRFVRMMQILRNAADDLQIILLSCHPSRFSRLQPGTTIELDKLRAEAEA